MVTIQRISKINNIDNQYQVFCFELACKMRRVVHGGIENSALKTQINTVVFIISSVVYKISSVVFIINSVDLSF